MKVGALDIGGANIKGCDSDGATFCRPFALWKNPEELTDHLTRCVEELAPFDRLAVTMTGELCDCFASKSEGVAHIVESVERAAAARNASAESICQYWRNDGVWASAAEVRGDPVRVAAANWLALADFAAEIIPTELGVLLDIGSTTTDMVLLAGGAADPRGRTDTERLLHGELLYTGVVRTPIAAAVGRLPYRGNDCPVAAELFATMRDVYVLLRRLEEEPHAVDTADGRPATAAHAVARLGRMLCAGADEFNAQDALVTATSIASQQKSQIVEAAEKLLGRAGGRVTTMVTSGSGEFLASEVGQDLGLRVLSLGDRIGARGSTAATAFALQHLASKQLQSRSPR